jgi:hypothetical protein
VVPYGRRARTASDGNAEINKERKEKPSMNFAEILAAKKDGRKAIMQKEIAKKKRFSGRLYNVIGYNLAGETITYSNVSASKAKMLRIELIHSGYYRVDRIETRTRILDENNKRTNLEFSEKNYVPVLEGSVPANGLATDKKIADDRNKMHINNTLKMMRRNNLIEKNDSGKVRIYDVVNGKRIRNNKGRFVSVPKLIFSGTDKEAVFFIMNSKGKFGDWFIYLPEKKRR